MPGNQFQKNIIGQGNHQNVLPERLDLKGRLKKFTQRVKRKIIRTVYDSPQSSTRRLVLQVEKHFGLRACHEIIINTNILQESLGKIPCCQYKMSKRD